jgi:hypothetical protein
VVPFVSLNKAILVLQQLAVVSVPTPGGSTGTTTTSCWFRSRFTKKIVLVLHQRDAGSVPASSKQQQRVCRERHTMNKSKSFSQPKHSYSAPWTFGVENTQWFRSCDVYKKQYWYYNSKLLVPFPHPKDVHSTCTITMESPHHTRGRGVATVSRKCRCVQ